MVLHQIDEAFVELVILVLHVLCVHLDAQNVFVERSGEVAFQQFIIVNCFGCTEKQ